MTLTKILHASRKLKETHRLRNLGKCFLRTGDLKELFATNFFFLEHQGGPCNNIKLQHKESENSFPGNYKIKVNPGHSSKKLTY